MTVHPGRFAPDALIVDEGQPLRDPGAAGEFVVQDEASQLVTLLAGPSPGGLVLDTCASPGGKATQMAASMKDEGTIVAADVPIAVPNGSARTPRGNSVKPTTRMPASARNSRRDRVKPGRVLTSALPPRLSRSQNIHRIQGQIRRRLPQIDDFVTLDQPETKPCGGLERTELHEHT